MTRDDRKLDDAARAAWLSHIGGKTQEEIARLMGISRQGAQRLVSQAMAEGLVKVRIDHPMARCLDLARALSEHLELDLCEVTPSLGSEALSGRAVANATSGLIEGWLRRPEPLVIGLGSGRTLRTAVEMLPHVDCDQHRIVSLTGSITPDGATAFYNVLFTAAEKVTAPTYPLPMPVLASSPEERAALLSQPLLTSTRALSHRTDVRFLGIGAIDESAPLLQDGFLSRDGRARLVEKGAVGEILGYVYDAQGELLDDPSNDCVSSTEMPHGPACPTIASAHGGSKIEAIRGAVAGRLITGLVTDEATAEALLSNRH